MPSLQLQLPKLNDKVVKRIEKSPLIKRLLGILWYLSIVISAGFLVILIYSISAGAKVSIGSDKWLEIERVNVVGEQTDPVIETYQLQWIQQSNSIVTLSNQLANSIPLSQLPQELQSSPSKAVKLIHRYFDAKNNDDNDLKFSLSSLHSEIHWGNLVNACNGNPKPQLMFHLQRCLIFLDYHEGDVDGDYDSICYSLKRFQQEYGLNTDGILGKKTLHEITKQLNHKRGIRLPEKKNLRIY